MLKKILIIPFFITFLTTNFNVCQANTAIEIIDNKPNDISISVVKASTIRVVGASGLTLHIYNIVGVHVMSIKVDSMDRYYDLNLPDGCYIAKIDRTVKKISIKKNTF